MGIPIYQVDAFTNRIFSGNPAGVCLLESPQPDEWMAAVAREMNLSETAFLLPMDGVFRLRWFTPAVEVALCGHATLASAHVLWQSGCLQTNQDAVFHTLSGVLTARFAGAWIEMDFPAKPIQPVNRNPELEEALGVPAVFTGKNQFDYLVETSSVDQVKALNVDIQRLRRLPVRGVIVTSAASGGYDFISRFFAPAVGVDEDPVTGSAHCALGPYWAGKLGKQDFLAYQASARGGEVGISVRGDRVLLRGQAVTVFQTTLCG